MLEPSQPFNEAPWTQVHTKLRGKRGTRVEFRFSPTYLRALWNVNASLLGKLRAAYYAPQFERLLLDDVIYIEDKAVFVRVWLIPAEEPDYFHLRVRVAAPARLTRNGQLFVHWDKYQYALQLKAGELEFEDISLPNFSRARHNLPLRRLRLSFEFENGRPNGKH